MIDNILLAFSSLRSNKMRALLTMLGIIIGIGSVIAIVTVGNSLTSSVNDSLISMGGNHLQVAVEARPDESGEYNYSYSYELTDLINNEMLDSFKERFSSQLREIMLRGDVGNGTVQDGRLYAYTNVIGVNNDYLSGYNLKLLGGRTFRDKDFDGARKVAIVSDYLVNNMFGGDVSRAQGQTIQVKLSDSNSVEEFVIIGVYKYENSGLLSGLMGGSPTSVKDTRTDLYIPITTEQQMNGTSQGAYFYIELAPEADVDANDLASRIEDYFEKNFYKNNPSFYIHVYNLKNEMSSITSVLDTISLAIGVIAGISLLVGGIGVMNIMLVSITERTREIGIRKALGAPSSAIRMQFIVEAMVICLVGGILGIGLGLGMGSIGARIMGSSASPNITTILIAVGFSMIIGIFFGYYPANKAAKMDPIEALRYE